MNTHKELLSECCSAKPCGEIAYDNSGRCGDCKEGCMFTEECDTSCGINADPADGFGKCTCGAELAEPTPPSQIEEDKITWDSIPAGWKGEREPVDNRQHHRTLLLIQKGKVIFSEEVTDDWIRSNYSNYGSQDIIVRQYHIDNWAMDRIGEMEEFYNTK